MQAILVVDDSQPIVSGSHIPVNSMTFPLGKRWLWRDALGAPARPVARYKFFGAVTRCGGLLFSAARLCECLNEGEVTMRWCLPHMVLILSAVAAGVRAETITVYTNASFAPLVIDAGHGLYPNLVEYLNRQNIPGMAFKLEYVPRKRIQV
jgi:hypothetical protein